MFRSFDLFILTFLAFLFTKLESFARIKVCFFGTCLSRNDRKISVNYHRSALFKLIFNNSLFNSFWNSWLSKILKLLYWMIFGFYFFVKKNQNRNDHFMEIWYTCFSMVALFRKLRGRFVRKDLYILNYNTAFRTCWSLTRLNKL